MASRTARGQTALLAALLAAGLALPILRPAAAFSASEPEVKQQKEELRKVHERIEARKARMKGIEEFLTRLATRVSATQDALVDIERQAERAERRIAELELEIEVLQEEIDHRSRDAYILGPGTGLEMMLSAESYDDLVDRIGFLSELNLRAGRAAEELIRAQDRLAAKQVELARLQASRVRLLRQLHRQRKLLQRKFEHQGELLASLQTERSTILAAISSVRPFAACPVDGPHAVADDWHAPRHGGGYHRHQGNDILAPYGTPVVAPFSGVAEEHDNKLGGIAVVVYGQFGYVYNAHLSEVGTLGPVHTGDVIGYVGDSGDAKGGPPHDHFEWHPNDGKAVDPHDYLMQVC